MNKKVCNQIKRAKGQGMNMVDLARMKAVAKKEAEKMEQRATEQAFVYMLAIPTLVLANDYWSKTAKKKIPQFIEDVVSLYESVQMGVVTEEELIRDLYELAGTTVDAEWEKNNGSGTAPRN